MSNQTEAGLRALQDELLALVTVAQDLGDREEAARLMIRAAALQDRLDALQRVDCDV